MYKTASGYPKLKMIRQHSYVPSSRGSWHCRTCLYFPGDLRARHKTPFCRMADKPQEA